MRASVHVEVSIILVTGGRRQCDDLQDRRLTGSRFPTIGFDGWSVLIRVLRISRLGIRNLRSLPGEREREKEPGSLMIRRNKRPTALVVS
jgi:hypothetical protein